MSKKSDREKREQIEQEKSQRMERFSSTLLEYLKDFSQYYRQDAPGEGALLLYRMGLQHLNEIELKMAFQESIKKCKFFPTVAEMLECLKEWQDRQPQTGTARHLEDYEPPTKEQKAELDTLWKEAWARIGRMGAEKSRLRSPMREVGED